MRIKTTELLNQEPFNTVHHPLTLKCQDTDNTDSQEFPGVGTKEVLQQPATFPNGPKTIRTKTNLDVVNIC